MYNRECVSGCSSLCVSFAGVSVSETLLARFEAGNPGKPAFDALAGFTSETDCPFVFSFRADFWSFSALPLCSTGCGGVGLTKRIVVIPGSLHGFCSLICDFESSASGCAFRFVVLRWSLGDSIGLCEEKNPELPRLLCCFARFGSGSRNMRRGRGLKVAPGCSEHIC